MTSQNVKFLMKAMNLTMLEAAFDILLKSCFVAVKEENATSRGLDKIIVASVMI